MSDADRKAPRRSVVRPAPELGAAVVHEAVRRARVESEAIDEVIMGCVLAAGLGQAPARQAALKAGLPPTVAAMTINKVCGSGLKAVMLADQVDSRRRCPVDRRRRHGEHEPSAVSPDRCPRGLEVRAADALDSMQHDGLWCAFEDMAMGAEADYIAASRQVSRADQDAFAVESHRRAIKAIEQGFFNAEIVPIAVPGRKGETIVSRDEGPRAETSTGCPGETASDVRRRRDRDGRKRLADQRRRGSGCRRRRADGSRAWLTTDCTDRRRATSGVAPEEIFIAPVTAIEKVLEKANLKMADIDLVELNEAFAAQCLACMRPLGLEPAKTNVSGGAIALGHPIGASGARVLVTLLHNLARLGLKRGLAALCLGGGNAVAMIVERM